MALGAGDGHVAADGLAGLGIPRLRGGGALEIDLAGGDGPGSGDGGAALLPQDLAADGHQLAAAGDGAVFQLDGGAALGVDHVALAAIDHQGGPVGQGQGAVGHPQTGLADLAAAGVALDEHLALHGDVSGGGDHGLVAGAVHQIAVGQIVDVGIDGGVFQNGPVGQAQLAVDGGPGEELPAAKVVIVHGEGAAALHVDDALDAGVPQGQLAAVFHHDAHVAQHFHVHQGQVAPGGDIQGLGDVARLHLLPGQVSAQHAIGPALVGAVPGLQSGGDPDAVLLPGDVAAKVGDDPGLHDVPHIFAVLGLLQGAGAQLVLCQLVGQQLLPGVHPEGQGVAGGRAALVVGDGDGDEIGAGVLGGAVQGEGAAHGGHEHAPHPAVAALGGPAVRVRHDVHHGLLHIAGGGVGGVVQLLPVRLLRLLALGQTDAVHIHGAVLVHAARAGGPGHAVIALLVHDGGLEGAVQLHPQLIAVALAVVDRQRGLAVGVDHQLELQHFIALGGNRDHVAALQHGNGGGAAAEVLLGKDDLIFVF